MQQSCFLNDLCFSLDLFEKLVSIVFLRLNSHDKELLSRQSSSGTKSGC
jgi:hypothetical protein